jgi:GT2 family glycosyltransferase
MKLSIIILSFNTKDLVAACLDSIYKNLKGIEYEIIVVDNASYDGTVSMLKFQYKKVKVIENDKNYGFAKGVNMGTKKATGDVLLFLNSDTELPKDNHIKNALEELEKDSIGIVGGLLLNSNKTIQRSFGKFYTPWRVFIMLVGGDRAEMALQKGEDNQSVDWVSGGFMFIKRDVFETVHGFDEHFFMYIEDMELCYRVKQKGYTVVFDTQIKVSHEGQGSSNRAFAIKNIYKNLLYFYKKHRSSFEYLIVKAMLVTKAYILIVVGILLFRKQLKKTYQEAVRF